MDLLKKDSEFQSHARPEWQMLKSFDRAFWMRHLKFGTPKDEKAVVEAKKYRPLHDEEGRLECPFNDPTQFSILNLNVKKV